jgi:hypothetical protein
MDRAISRPGTPSAPPCSEAVRPPAEDVPVCPTSRSGNLRVELPDMLPAWLVVEELRLRERRRQVLVTEEVDLDEPDGRTPPTSGVTNRKPSREFRTRN